MRWFRRKKADTSAIGPAVTSSSVQQFEWSRGRRLVADLPYLLPKDLEESSRLDFQHYLLKYVLGGLYAAPTTNPRAILDVATGTGRWAIEMAQKFPDANVVGFDVVPPPIDSDTAKISNRPENFTFVQGDILQRLPFADNTFDFVHMRLVYSAVPVAQWQGLVNELTRVTAPRGWIELAEAFIMLNSGPVIDKLQQWAIEAVKSRGVDITYGQYIGLLLQQAGLQHIQERMVEIPLGRYGGRLGEMAAQNLISIFKGMGAGVVRRGIASSQDYDDLLQQMPVEIEARQVTSPFFQAYGQKQ